MRGAPTLAPTLAQQHCIVGIQSVSKGMQGMSVQLPATRVVMTCHEGSDSSPRAVLEE